LWANPQNLRRKIVVNAIVKYTGGGAIAPALVGKVKVFDDAPDMESLFNSYYGFDPAAFAGMSVDEIAAFVDSVEEIKFLVKNLEKLEEHVKDYINGVVEYNQFVARCLKAGATGMEKIDQATLDTFLAWKGWQTNTKKLAKKSDVSVRLLDQELADCEDLEEYDLEISLKVMANKLKRKKETLASKPDDEEANSLAQQQTALERRRIQNLINYGTKKNQAALPQSMQSAQPISTGSNWVKTWGGKAFDFFSGR
jgi:hypothetical protein